MSALAHARAMIMATIALTAAGAAALAADAGQLARSLTERLEVSMQAYQDQSARIADEKIPLVREINRLEDENLALRDRIEAARRLTVENNSRFDGMRNRLEGLKAQSEFALRFLAEYLDTFETRIQIAEDQHYKPQLTDIREAVDTSRRDLTARFGHHLAALELGLTRAETVVGGRHFPGNALAPGGILRSGTIAVFGPSAYFSDGAANVGVVRLNPGTIEPAIALLTGAPGASIEQFFRGHTGPLPLDASLGNAIAVQSTNLRLRDHIARGGPVGYAIILLGLVALALTVVKLFDLALFRSVAPAELAAIIRDARARDETGAIARARKVSGPMGEMLETGVRHIRANLVLLEELMLSVVLRRRPDVERFLPFLAITVVAAPLLGLLGTVVGMIRTFALITIVGTGDPRALSSGISEALITTEFGLMVAIPVVVVHAVLTRMIKSRFGDMERVAFEFVKTVALEEDAALPSAAPAPVATR